MQFVSVSQKVCLTMVILRPDVSWFSLSIIANPERQGRISGCLAASGKRRSDLLPNIGKSCRLGIDPVDSIHRWLGVLPAKEPVASYQRYVMHVVRTR